MRTSLYAGHLRIWVCCCCQTVCKAAHPRPALPLHQTPQRVAVVGCRQCVGNVLPHLCSCRPVCRVPLPRVPVTSPPPLPVVLTLTTHRCSSFARPATLCTAAVVACAHARVHCDSCASAFAHCKAGYPRRRSRSYPFRRNYESKHSSAARRSASPAECTLASHSARAALCSRTSCHGACAVERRNESGSNDRTR